MVAVFVFFVFFVDLFFVDYSRSVTWQFRRLLTKLAPPRPSNEKRRDTLSSLLLCGTQHDCDHTAQDILWYDEIVSTTNQSLHPFRLLQGRTSVPLQTVVP